MAYLDSFSHKEAYSNQVEIPGIASVIHEDLINQATWGNHCELSATTILAVYNDVTNGKGMVRIGTRVSDFAIEWGTAVQFDSSTVASIIPVRVSDTKFLIAYKSISSDFVTCIAGTVIGTVPTLGTKLNVTGNLSGAPIGAVLMDTDKLMIAFNYSTLNGQAVIASLTGTTIAYGTPFIFKATTNIALYPTTLTQLCVHSTTLATVVYYVSETVTQCICLALSGTTITTPSAAVAFGGSAALRYPSIGALSATAFAVAYTDITDTNKGNAQIGTISGTTITAGASEYAFDTANYATRIPTIAIISSTLFGVAYAYGASTLAVKIGVVAATVITFGSATVITDGSSVYYYPSMLYTSTPRLTYTTSGKLTFSYLTSTLNQFVCGMLTQNYNVLTLTAMCYKVATAGASEQIEISSVYLKGNSSGFYMPPSGLTTAFTAWLYLNGTISSKAFYDVLDAWTTYNSSGSMYRRSVTVERANKPIILLGGQSLYASINTIQGDTNKGSCTVFGLKRSA